MKLKQRIRDWLEIKDPVEPKPTDDLQKKFNKLESDLKYWRNEFKSRQPQKKCTKCKELISLWPFEDSGYYIKGNRVTHIACNTGKKS